MCSRGGFLPEGGEFSPKAIVPELTNPRRGVTLTSSCDRYRRHVTSIAAAAAAAKEGGNTMKYCAQCGAQLVDEAVVCPHCGCAVAPTKTVDPNASPKSRLITLLLCIFVGGLGIHRFYVGKIGTGVLWLLTAGCFGIGALVDLIMIACGTFTDSDGKPVTDWQT